jgi:hypothetical protein
LPFGVIAMYLSMVSQKRLRNRAKGHRNGRTINDAALLASGA